MNCSYYKLHESSSLISFFCLHFFLGYIQHKVVHSSGKPVKCKVSNGVCLTFELLLRFRLGHRLSVKLGMGGVGWIKASGSDLIRATRDSDPKQHPWNNDGSYPIQR
uniref:Uncharacterized protein n=1 Tax=Proboscia inermis TaxID=420281 RepID=A0A7S0CDQ1_9STRA